MTRDSYTVLYIIASHRSVGHSFVENQWYNSEKEGGYEI
jgi:hypothetical protein